MRNHDVNFMNAPLKIYEILDSKKDSLGIEDIYIIRNVFGMVGIYLLVKENSSINEDSILRLFDERHEDDLENRIKEVLEFENYQTNRVDVVDYIDKDQIYIECNGHSSTFGEFLMSLYNKNVKAEKHPYWLLERHLQFTTWFKENDVEKPIFNTKIITGYSYKGGMGRSTLIALLAAKTAMEGKKVVVLDFDFEAPGISSLFVDFSKKRYSKGILDYIIEKPILKDKAQLDGYYTKVDNTVVLPITGRKMLISGDIIIFPASDMSGTNTDNYMQKISRVNFSSFNEFGNNVLVELLKEIDSVLKPDIVFIDSRTGISDIGGVSLKGLSDVNICIFANDRQNFDGMKILLPLFYDSKDVKKSAIIVQSLLRLPPSSPFIEKLIIEEQKSFRNELIKMTNFIEEDKDFEEIFNIFNMKYTEELTVGIDYSGIVKLLEERKDFDEYFVNSMYKEVIKPLAFKNVLIFNQKAAVLNRLIEAKAGAEDTFLTPEDFKERFLFTDKFAFIFKDEKFIITGNKGEGKSALFSLLQHEIIYEAYMGYLKRERILDLKTTWDKTKNVFVEGFTQNVDGINFPSSSQFRLVFEKCKGNLDFYENFWECFTLYKFQHYLGEERHIFSSIDEVVELFDKPYIIKDVYSNLRQISREILAEDEKKIYFIYDYLDVYISKISEIRIGIISGLLSMWQKWYKIYPNLKCKIFLRNDIYEGIYVSNNTHLDDYKISLVWDYEDLLRIVIKYLISTFEEISQELSYVIDNKDKDLGIFITKDSKKIYEAVEMLFGESIRGGFAKTFRWIRNHLCDANNSITPRTILWMLSIGAYYEKAMNKYLNQNDVLIHGVCLKSALKGQVGVESDTISNKKVKELREEYPEIFEYLKDLDKELFIVTGSKTFPVKEKELLKVIDNITEKRKQEINKFYSTPISAFDVIKKLQEIGVLKVHKNNSMGMQYIIPDLYLYGLGLTRKGV